MLETRKERRKLIVDEESKDERREKAMQMQETYAECSGGLGGGNFVVSGVFENITRENLEKFIKKNGGRLIQGVTGKTDYLVVGKLLDDNRPVTEGGKYQRAILLKKKIMTEKEFELFCRDRLKNPDFLLGRQKHKDPIGNSSDHFLGSGKQGASEIDGVDDITELLARKAQQQETTSSSTSLKVSPKATKSI